MDDGIGRVAVMRPASMFVKVGSDLIGGAFDIYSAGNFLIECIYRLHNVDWHYLLPLSIRQRAAKHFDGAKDQLVRSGFGNQDKNANAASTAPDRKAST